jgi:hypothetical protein
MLNLPPPTRIALGTVEVGGKKVELFLSPEWARYFQSLNTQVQENGTALMKSAALPALLSDAMEAPDLFPAPPGPPGMQGAPGMALFMLQDDVRDEPLLLPPSVDGVYVPLNSKDASSGVPGLTQFKLNLKNAAGTITSWLATAATVARTWTMPDKDGTVAVLSDFSAPPAIGSTAAAAGNFTSLSASGSSNLKALTATTGNFTTVTASAGFGCNGKTAQSAAASGGTLAGVIAALVANGILSS